jgi:hypothetical protein
MDVGMTPAEKAGILWPMQWVLDTLPHWAAPFIGFVLTFGVMAVGRLIEREPLRLAQQYKGLWPGDAFLGFAIAFMVTGVTDYSPLSVHGWWQSPVVQYAALGVSLVPVVLLTVVEYTLSIKEYNRERRARFGGYFQRKEGVYRPYQLFTPTNLGHRAILVIMSFVVLQLTMATWGIGTVPLPLKIVATACLLSWVYCAFVYDNQPKHSRPYLPHVHPTHNAWGTKWISINSQRRPVQQQPTQRQNDVPPVAPQSQYWVSQNQLPANTGVWPTSGGSHTGGWSGQSHQPGYGNQVPDYGQPQPSARHFVAPATQPPMAPRPQPEPPVAPPQSQPGVPTVQPSGRPSFGPPATEFPNK